MKNSWIYVLTFCTASLCFLGLSGWQFYRLNWKNQVTNNLTVAVDTPDFSLPLDILEYSHIKVNGKLLNHLSMHVFLGPQRYSLVTPLKIEESNNYILVNQGSTPNKQKPKSVDKVIEITGNIICSIKGSAFIKNNAEKNEWIYIHPKKMGEYLNLDLHKCIIRMETNPDPNIMDNGVIVPHNNHLSYAITWMMLSVITLIIMVLKLRSKC